MKSNASLWTQGSALTIFHSFRLYIVLELSLEKEQDMLLETIHI